MHRSIGEILVLAVIIILATSESSFVNRDIAYGIVPDIDKEMGRLTVVTMEGETFECPHDNPQISRQF